jgi:hypothetical protein
MTSLFAPSKRTRRESVQEEHPKTDAAAASPTSNAVLATEDSLPQSFAECVSIRLIK